MPSFHLNPHFTTFPQSDFRFRPAIPRASYPLAIKTLKQNSDGPIFCTVAKRNFWVGDTWPIHGDPESRLGGGFCRARRGSTFG